MVTRRSERVNLNVMEFSQDLRVLPQSFKQWINCHPEDKHQQNVFAIQRKEIYPLNGVIHPPNYLGLGILASLRFCLLQALAGKTGQIALKKYNIR